MTLGDMRANSVHTLDVTCRGRFCHHFGPLDVSTCPNDVPAPSFRPRMVCTAYSAIGADCAANLAGPRAALLIWR